MGLLELLREYSKKCGGIHFIVFADDGSCSVRDPYMKFIVSFGSPRKMRAWLVKETQESAAEDKVYL